MALYEESARVASHSNDSRPLGSIPAEFDASAHPIIAQHWFGLRPEVAAQGIPDGKLRFQEAQAA